MYQKILVVICGLFILVACKAQPKKAVTPATPKKQVPKTGTTADPRYTVTKKSFGLIQLTDDYDAVVKHYGADKVSEAEVTRAPESEETVTKTFINKGTKNEIVIQWADDAFHTKILAIEANQPNHSFKTSDGIKYGTNMTSLVKINGAKISFSGFNWGFGGLISNYHGGKLTMQENKASISYELQIEPSVTDSAITGDVILNSEMAKVKKYISKIFVYKITLFNVL
jgi:hypothetical protein